MHRHDLEDPMEEGLELDFENWVRFGYEKAFKLEKVAGQKY